ncbi:Pyrroline-5-carboxylate reductase [Hyphodiscus hymeniophilus]|uniref:Pyrroline-5-carboxylate reductase n=1 Tax=Hyphodiscus hymeniophilus TaxID=353542 RepID=A0A9P6SL61_9HELO|nr:Pyrroline-5-carboxylate reductase [Hyphodiscus hymeniophilus]
MATTNAGTPRTGMTLAVVGCGIMGTAILSCVMDSCAKAREAGEEPRITKFIACVNSKGSAERLKSRFKNNLNRLTVLQQDNVRGMKEADIVLLGCKPYMAKMVLTAVGVREALKGKLVISVLAGTPVPKMQSLIWGQSEDNKAESQCFVVRGMCNIAAEFGQSMTVIETIDMPEDLMELTNWIFLQLGKTAPIAPDLFDIGGVLAGPSGVFLSVAIDGILDGAVSQGLKRAQARTMMTQSLVGLARLLEQGNTPDQLREKFSSPRGTTIAGLLSLEEDRVRYAFSKAVIASAHRSETM